MTIEHKLLTLEQEREKLKKELTTICWNLEQLYSKKALLLEKIKDLKTRGSSLAKTLMEKVQMQLQTVMEEIDQEHKKEVETNRALEVREKKIYEIKNNVISVFIELQTAEMAYKFFEYLGAHFEDIGYQIKVGYQIKPVTFFDKSTYFGCYIPTGDIGICEQNMKNFIVTSHDFKSKESLYTIDREEEGGLSCAYTDWFKKYINDFATYLLRTLKTQNPYEDTFKIIPESCSFTIELI